MANRQEANARKIVAWQRHIDAHSRSGLSQQRYCESRGLSLSTFQLWRRRLAAGEIGRASECVELVPVTRSSRSDESSNAPQAAVVLCVREYRLEIDEGATADILRRVLDVLETR